MATAHSYLRYSTPEQALGDSERRQIEKAQQWAVANGMITMIVIATLPPAPFEARTALWGCSVNSLMMSDPVRFQKGISYSPRALTG